MRIALVGLVTASLLLGASSRGAWAQESAPAQTPPTRPQSGQIAVPGGDATFDPNQLIKPSFQLSISVTSGEGNPEPDLTGPVQVDATGSIQLKLIGLVQLRGLTPVQAADKIANLLKPYLKDPKVTVTILSVPKPIVFLSGAVNQKGPIPVNDDTTLAQMVTIIGFDENADLSKVRVITKDEMGKPAIREYDLLRWLKPAPGEPPDQTQSPVLSDRDFVFVPLKALPGTGIVLVEGAVVRPGPVSIRVGVPTTLREALSAVGGPISTPGAASLAAATSGEGPQTVSAGGGPPEIADRKQVILRRLGVDRPLVLDYDKAESGDPVHNVVLQPDDVIYVQRLSEDRFINMNGGFIRPGRRPYAKAMTLTQAIGDAGGIALNAKEHEGRIYRHLHGADPTRTQVIAFNYKKIRANQEPDHILEPGDTVEIPLGNPPRPPLDSLQLAQSLLSIALLVDRLTTGRGFR